ncbi:RNA polymerase sigma factor [Planktotalea sp.]|uniref:RNA polymerase sigma factor n=1 Tax=Planktotalea sp. TaxID=2029877 RepID=UPI003F6D16B2
MSPSLTSKDEIERVVREEWGRILASLVKTLGDFQMAEDCLQDALISAFEHWERSGLPNSPAGWLLKTARRKAIDRIRRDRGFAAKLPELTYLYELENVIDDAEESAVIPDERLQMIFICCHPALAEKSRVALTLRSLGGLSTDQIAAAFLDTGEATQRRITRAKVKIKGAGIAYKVPDPEDLPARLDSVLRTLYLIFNEGYSASSGDALTRVDLSDEAIRLARITAALMPDECEVQGLLALMLLHDSRRSARVGPLGEVVTLEHQNREMWDRGKIEEGTAILQACLPLRRTGPYQIQAAISGVHAHSDAWERTDWAQIVDLYSALLQFENTSVVRLNQAVATSMAGDVEQALSALNLLDDLESYAPFHLARAEVFGRLKRMPAAKEALGLALEHTQNAGQAEFIRKKLGYLH